VTNGEVSMANSLWRKELEREEVKFYDSTSDTAVAAGLLLNNYAKSGDIESSLKTWYDQLFDYGIQSTLGLLVDPYKKEEYLIFSRDGARPMFEVDASSGDERHRLFASEDSPLKQLKASSSKIKLYGLKEVPKGCVGFYDLSNLKEKIYLMDRHKKTCAFEKIYMCSPFSTVDGEIVSDVRLRLGEELEKEHPTKEDEDVTYLPNSGKTFADGASRFNHRPVNEYIRKVDREMRIFMSDQDLGNVLCNSRKQLEVSPNVKGRKLRIFDDSMVKGVNSRGASEKCRDQLAKKVSFSICSSPIVYGCYGGVDLPEETLLARRTGLDPREIVKDHSILEKVLAENPPDFWGNDGPDSVSYLSLEGLRRALNDPEGTKHCLGCMDGCHQFIHEGMQEGSSCRYVPVKRRIA
jgi:amidophosphoribosyltransferase